MQQIKTYLIASTISILIGCSSNTPTPTTPTKSNDNSTQIDTTWSQPSSIAALATRQPYTCTLNTKHLSPIITSIDRGSDTVNGKINVHTIENGTIIKANNTPFSNRNDLYAPIGTIDSKGNQILFASQLITRLPASDGDLEYKLVYTKKKSGTWDQLTPLDIPSSFKDMRIPIPSIALDSSDNIWLTWIAKTKYNSYQLWAGYINETNNNINIIHESYDNLGSAKIVINNEGSKYISWSQNNSIWISLNTSEKWTMPKKLDIDYNPFGQEWAEYDTIFNNSNTLYILAKSYAHGLNFYKIRNGEIVEKETLASNLSGEIYYRVASSNDGSLTICWSDNTRKSIYSKIFADNKWIHDHKIESNTQLNIGAIDISSPNRIMLLYSEDTNSSLHLIKSSEYINGAWMPSKQIGSSQNQNLYLNKINTGGWVALWDNLFLSGNSITSELYACIGKYKN